MNHREIDAKVAECLGWMVFDNRYLHIDGDHEVWPEVPYFSTTGDAMLILIEEARKHEIYLEFVHLVEGFQGEARRKSADNGQKLIACMDEPVESAPLAVALAFLKAKGVDVRPYVKGVKTG